jgi:hypothetical protein
LNKVWIVSKRKLPTAIAAGSFSFYGNVLALQLHLDELQVPALLAVNDHEQVTASL